MAEGECSVISGDLEKRLSLGSWKQEVDVDESLWCRLPEELVDIVLAWLPLASYVRFRCVCKRWRSLISSQSFLDLRSKAPSCGGWLLSFGDDSPVQHPGAKLEGRVYEPASDKRFNLQFPFLPEDSIPVASAEGLVCFCSNTLNENYESDVSFYVCNPLTKAWKRTPSVCARATEIAFIVDRASNTYKIIVFCIASTDHWLWMSVLDYSAKEYDSKINRWRTIGGLYRGEQFRPGTIFCYGKVHLLSSETVQAIDLKQGEWTKFAAPAYSSCAKLVECHGRLLLVGDMVHLNVFHLPNIQSYIGVVIWELDPTSNIWLERGRMPEAMVESLSYSSFSSLSCVVLGDLIYIFSSLLLQNVVVYDNSQQTWKLLQHWCNELPSRVFFFNPSLDITA